MSSRQTVPHFMKTAVATVLGTALGETNGCVQLTTLSGPAKGLRFQLDLKRRLEYAYWLGRYDEVILTELTRLCRPGQTVWDCGTYLGYYTCFLGRLVGTKGRVISFEADAANLERTRTNAALNGLTNVALVHKAISGRSGPVELLLSDSTNSHLPGCYVGGSRDEYARIESTGGRTVIEATTLDDACYVDGWPAPHLVKIDIEGAEGDALKGATWLCREIRPTLVLELHNPECDRAAWQWAQTHDYRLRRFGETVELRSEADVWGTLLCEPRG